MPQIFTASEVARPAYYDRQAIPVINNYNVVNGPHGLTTRWTYTPSFLFAAFIEVLFVRVTRQAVSGAVGSAAAQVNLLPFYGGTSIVAEVDSTSNVVGAKETMQVTSLGYMAYGDTLQAQTFDFDTGGTWQFLITSKGTEFFY